RTAVFESRVLRRQHAEAWVENGRVLIRDVKSLNGTFGNGERLSLEGVESDLYELRSDGVPLLLPRFSTCFCFSLASGSCQSSWDLSSPWAVSRYWVDFACESTSGAGFTRGGAKTRYSLGLVYMLRSKCFRRGVDHPHTSLGLYATCPSSCSAARGWCRARRADVSSPVRILRRLRSDAALGRTVQFNPAFVPLSRFPCFLSPPSFSRS
ncbi:hypothetical protein B0H14DRAFT_2371032, partial [Mycena olivaceomarginata]